MPRSKLPKKSKIDIAKPKESKILISTPVKSKIDIRKKKETKILMPEALRAHMLEKEANRLYMRDMKTQNIEYKTEDKTENETEVDMFVVRGIPTAQKLKLPRKSNKSNSKSVRVPNTGPVRPIALLPVTLPNTGPSGKPKELGNTYTAKELPPTTTPSGTLADIVIIDAPKADSKKKNKIAKQSPRKSKISPKPPSPPALAPLPREQARLQPTQQLPQQPSPTHTRSPMQQLTPTHQKVEINRPPQRRRRNTKVTTNILPQAVNTKKEINKVIKIQTIRRAQQARKATKARAKARKEELKRIEQERIERERKEREHKERERKERERKERERKERERKERERKERERIEWEIEEQKHKATKIQAVVRGKKLRQNKTRQRKNKQAAFLMLKRQKNKKMSNNKLTKKANEKRKKVAFNIIKKEKEELKTYGNNGNNYENYEPYEPFNPEPFNPEPVGRVSYVPYGQTENNVLEKLEMANTKKHLLRQLEFGNKFTYIFGDRTPTNLVKNVLDENLSNNPIEVQEQLDDVIEILAKAATNIQTKYRGKKDRIHFNTLKRKKESSKMLKNLGRFQQQKLNLIKKQLVRNQLVKGKGDKKLNMNMKANVLGLDLETATKRDIEAAYRKFSRLYHPNKNLLIKEARNYLLRYVNEPSRTLDLQNTTFKPLALQYKPKNIIHPSLSSKRVPSYKHIPKRKRSVNDTQSIRNLRSTANVKIIKQRNEVKKAGEKARVVEILDQHISDMLNKRHKKLTRIASAATKVQTTQRRRLAQMQATQRKKMATQRKKLASAATKVQATQRKRSAVATRRRLTEQEQQRKRAEEERGKREAQLHLRAGIERDLMIQAELNKANIERVKRERSQRGVMILNEKRKERIEREKREAQQAEDLRLAKKAAAELAGAAMTKGSEYVEAMRAGKDTVKQHGKAVMQTAAPLMSWVKGYVQNKAEAAGKWHADFQAERAERQKQEKIESDAKKKRNNATRRRIERSEEAQEILIEKNYILRKLEEIKGLNTEIREKKRKLNKLGPYERWMAYINKLDHHETTARIRGRPITDPPRPEQNLVNWAKNKYGNLNLSGLITEIKRRPPISRSEVEHEIQQMKQRKQTKSSLQRKLRELNEMYEKLFA